MSKGNKIPITAPKKIGIDSIDETFPRLFDPTDTLAKWNNKLDDIVNSLKGIASDIRRESNKDEAAKEVGKAKVEVTSEGLVVCKVMSLEEPDQELTKLPKATQERLKMVTKKAKMLHSKRLAALRKQGEKYAEATFVIDEEDESGTKVKLQCDTSEIEDKDVVQDLRRSLAKFNDRVDLLKGNLKGIPSLKDAVYAILSDMKKYIEEKGEQLKATIESGLPKFDIPDSIIDALSPLLKKAWETLQKLIDFAKELTEKLPGMKDKVEAVVEEAKGMPAKVKEAANSLDPRPNPKQMLNMLKAAKANVAKVTQAPNILNTLSKTLKETTVSLVEAVESVTGQKGESAE